MDQDLNDEPDSTSHHEPSPEEATRSPWSALLFFTTKRHMPIAIPSFALSMLSGCIEPTEAFLYGKIFSTFASFGGGATTGKTFMEDVDKYCLWLVALGAATWLLTGGDFSSWTVYGAIKANNARRRLFHAMLDREMEWFDLRKQGVSSLLTRLNL